MNQGIIGSMRDLGVTESYKLKRQVILSASEAAEMILRVDDSKFPVFFPLFFNDLSVVLIRVASVQTVLRSAPRRRDGGH